MMKDNYDFFREHEAKEAAWLAKRPVCAKCGEPIQDEYAYDINDDGQLFCEECKDEWLEEHQVDVDNYVQERTENVW